MKEEEIIAELQNIIKERIKNLDITEGWHCNVSDTKIEALQSAIKVVEKQLLKPKEPIDKPCMTRIGEVITDICPVCKCYITKSDYDYCHWCGQHINNEDLGGLKNE